MSLRVSHSYRAFHLPRLTAGVGLKTGANIWSTALGLTVVADSYILGILFILIAATTHLALAWFFKKDHKLFESYAVHMEAKDKYDAGCVNGAKGFANMTRTKGYGKGLSC
jgi:hypothetical protein